MNLNNLRKDNEVLDIFCKLVSIPSPSLKEEKVIEWILNFCAENNINARKDSYGNVYIRVPGSDSSKEPLMLSSHMDVVGDDVESSVPVDQFDDGHGADQEEEDFARIAELLDQLRADLGVVAQQTQYRP